MRMRRLVHSTSKFLSQLGAALVKTVFTSVVLGAVVVSIMRYMELPVPSPHELLGGLSKLADVL